MTPLELYQQHIDEQLIEANSYQLQAMQRLNVIHHQLIKRHKKRASTAGQIRRKIKPRPPIKGLYLWGSVGIGKTYVVDLFYETLPIPKIRQHFHQFMRNIHQQLKNIQGEENPLEHIAKQIADQYLVIFLDEFLVADITDAMILGQLLQALFRYGACLITTSNTSPENLYLKGIQRERFLPAIELLKKYTTVIHQQTNKDYRREHLQRAGIYFTPLNEQAQKNMGNSFAILTDNQPTTTSPINILNRNISIIKASQRIIWFDFTVICNRPRSQNDYLELIKHYDTFLVSNTPIMKPTDYHYIIPFIKFVDVLYDAKKRLILSAATTPSQLYPKGEQRSNFERTVSRIIEMGSQRYITPNEQ
jgi:cell division protein ZapE